MSIQFNADEVFEIAEKIEKNGVEFYRKAAEFFSDQTEISQLMLNLAAMEDEHRIIYAAMRAELGSTENDDTIFDPDNQVKEYLHAIAGVNVFNLKDGPRVKLKGDETPEKVFHLAIEAEKDSIIFYLGLKDMIPQKLGRDKINGVIQEEQRHIVLLSKQLNALKSA